MRRGHRTPQDSSLADGRGSLALLTLGLAVLIGSGVVIGLGNALVAKATG